MIELVGGLAALVTVIQVSLQVRDVYGSERPDGVSWLTWELALIQSLGLFAFSLDQGYVAATAVNAIVAVLSAVVLWRILSVYGRPSMAVALIGVTAAGFGALGLAGETRTAGSIGSIASAFVWIPQAARSVASRSPAGLSRAFVAAGLLSSGLWAAYALALEQWRLLVPPLAAILSMIVTGIFALTARGRD